TRSSFTTPVTREALDNSFEAATRDLVLAWDPDDERPPDERSRALRDCIYETYESSAWIPQSLFDGNVVAQAIAGDVDTIVRDRVGLVLWPENPFVRAFGMAPGIARDAPLKWTVNCVLCHTAEIDGRVYFGAGTKTFDEKVLGDALKLLTDPRGRVLTSPGAADEAFARQAHDILTRHHHDKI